MATADPSRAARAALGAAIPARGLFALEHADVPELLGLRTTRRGHHHIATLIGDPLRLIDDAVEFRQTMQPQSAA